MLVFGDAVEDLVGGLGDTIRTTNDSTTGRLSPRHARRGNSKSTADHRPDLTVCSVIRPVAQDLFGLADFGGLLQSDRWALAAKLT